MTDRTALFLQCAGHAGAATPFALSTPSPADTADSAQRRPLEGLLVTAARNRRDGWTRVRTDALALAAAAADRAHAAFWREAYAMARDIAAYHMLLLALRRPFLDPTALVRLDAAHGVPACAAPFRLTLRDGERLTAQQADALSGQTAILLQSLGARFAYLEATGRAALALARASHGSTAAQALHGALKGPVAWMWGQRDAGGGVGSAGTPAASAAAHGGLAHFDPAKLTDLQAAVFATLRSRMARLGALQAALTQARRQSDAAAAGDYRSAVGMLDAVRVPGLVPMTDLAEEAREARRLTAEARAAAADAPADADDAHGAMRRDGLRRRGVGSASPPRTALNSDDPHATAAAAAAPPAGHPANVDLESELERMTPQARMMLEEENEALLADLEDQTASVRAATQRIADIAALQDTLAHHLQVQEESINTLFDEAGSATIRMRAANTELASARERFGETRLWVLMVFLVASGVLLFLDYYGS
ncbi:hypothetical protein CXG81DRAFT_19934 [Caulochytrium protostelioides]|uniref:t-SNARE coiled-coil homology domain-containing protein n=1 Tax=Caulochytrium protostelioides TaxID=1555241 RepID=A0A4P9X4P7_9FUNG|nr:hypothetical protein CXG81DRAFT_19934 [Caulochytrium protostelioides]|eukprot:RKP00053.1 hypothetical protein CXG81DRAFT_19934 [Caulochytrium protostelioides]